MSPKSAESQYRGILYFACHFFEKCASNRPKADKGGYYILYSILLKNEPQIGQKPIKGDFILNFAEK
jgi:hypothetical protein